MFKIFLIALRAVVTTDEGKYILTQFQNYLTEMEGDLEYYKSRVNQLIEESGEDFRAHETRIDECQKKIADLEAEVKRLTAESWSCWPTIKGYPVTVYALVEREIEALRFDPNHPITVIKMVRERVDCGLIEAKNSVDYFLVKETYREHSGQFHMVYSGGSVCGGGNVVYEPPTR